jgi:AcrR family transcriptional regulator
MTGASRQPTAASADAAAARPLRRDAVENRARLLQAAWDVFAEQGTEAGVEEIAKRAGVGMGTLYRRFPTKDDLIRALQSELLDGMLEEIRQTAAAQPAGHGLEACLWHGGEVMAAHRGCLGMMWQAFPLESDPRRAEFWELMGRLLEQAREAGEVREDLTLTDVYLCQLTLRSLIDDSAVRAPEIWRRYLALMLAGFRPAAQPLEHRPSDDSLVTLGVPYSSGGKSARR